MRMRKQSSLLLSLTLVLVLVIFSGTASLVAFGIDTGDVMPVEVVDGVLDELTSYEDELKVEVWEEATVIARTEKRGESIEGFQAITAMSSPIVTEIGSIRIHQLDQMIHIIQGTSMSELDGVLRITVYDTAGVEIGVSSVMGSMISGLNTDVLGVQTITVTFQGISDTTQVFVLDGHLGECTCSDESNWVLSFWGGAGSPISFFAFPVGSSIEDNLAWINLFCDLCDVHISGTYVTNDMVNGFDSSTPGFRTISITYRGLTITEEVKFEALDDASIEIWPQFLFLKQGTRIENLNVRGWIESPSFTVGSIPFIVTDNMLSNFNSNQLGRQEVTVTFLGLTTTFTIEVVLNPNLQEPCCEHYPVCLEWTADQIAKFQASLELSIERMNVANRLLNEITSICSQCYPKEFLDDRERLREWVISTNETIAELSRITVLRSSNHCFFESHSLILSLLEEEGIGRVIYDLTAHRNMLEQRGIRCQCTITILCCELYPNCQCNSTQTNNHNCEKCEDEGCEYCKENGSNINIGGGNNTTSGNPSTSPRTGDITSLVPLLAIALYSFSVFLGGTWFKRKIKRT